MATEELEVVAAKFSFRPARSLTDSAEKLRPPSQPQPTPEKVLEENNRAAAAASQPLPVSDDEEDEHLDEDGSEDGDIKGVTRSSAHAGENGNGPAVSGAAAASAPAPAAGGWGADFLKQNQAQAAAAKEAAEKAIAAAEKGGAQSQPQPSAAAGGWGADFLKSNKATGDAAGAALQAELEKEAGKTNSGVLQALVLIASVFISVFFVFVLFCLLPQKCACTIAEMATLQLQAPLLLLSRSPLASHRHQHQIQQLLQAQARFTPPSDEDSNVHTLGHQGWQSSASHSCKRARTDVLRVEAGMQACCHSLGLWCLARL
jgi:hypothetical protein